MAKKVRAGKAGRPGKGGPAASVCKAANCSYFQLRDTGEHGGGSVTGVIGHDCTGMLVKIDGYGDKCSKDGQGAPILIELVDGQLRLIVWADINKEDPTHIISLEGARDGARIDG